MALPQVTINKQQNQNSRKPAGFDFYSGIIFYGTAPTVTGKWAEYVGTPTIKAQQMFSPSDITSAGIIPYSDNTAPTATYLITNAATAAGEDLPISIVEPRANSTTETIDLGTYETVTGDTVIDTLGANLAAFINAGTSTHGYSASFNTVNDTLTITAPKYVGVSLNSGTPLVIDESGTDIAGTITQFSAGTASNHAVWSYHISEYFRIYEEGVLWVGIIASSSSFNEVTTLQKIAAGSKLRQVGVFDTDSTRGAAANISGTILSLQNAVLDSELTAPFVSVYSPEISGVSDLSTLPDQNINTSNKVQCVISQDGDNDGALLYVRFGKTVGNIGAKLATIAKSRVSGSDAAVTTDFNVSDGVENNVIAFGNGSLSTSVSSGVQTQLDNYNYTFLRAFGDTVIGSYWTDNKCCITQASSYAYVNDNRVADKISRILRAAYIPLLSSELIFNSDGTLQDFTIEYFTNVGTDAVTNDMITGFGNLPLISGVSITIDPTQKVKVTNNLSIGCGYIQNGIARNITVDIAPVDSI